MLRVVLNPSSTFPQFEGNWGRRFVIAILSPIIALLLRYMLGDIVRQNGAFIFFVPAVMLTAWYGGLGPGLTATIVSAVLCDYFVLKPDGSFAQYPEDLPRLLVFLLVGAQISWLGGMLRAARRRAEDDARAARRSEALYRSLARNVPHAIIGLYDGELRIAVADGAGLAEAGLPTDPRPGGPLRSYVPVEAGNQVEALCRESLSVAEARCAEVVAGDRTYFVQAVPLGPQAGGGVLAGLVVMQDDTERVQAQAALRQAAADLERRVRERTAELDLQKTLLECQSEASRDAVLAVSADDRVLHANRRLQEVWGLDEAIAAGSPIEDVRRAMRLRHAGPLDPLGDGAGLHGLVGPREVDELALRDGRTLERYSAPITAQDGTCYGRVWYYRDTTERKRLERAIIEAGDQERQRIGQDLHDDLCQQLSGIACLARVLEERLSAKRNGEGVPANAAAEANRIVTLVQEAAGRARDLARGLQPVRLRIDGLDVALRELCDRSAEMFSIDCDYQGDNGGKAAVGPSATHLYRIAQEAIHNAVRHGHATAIRVDLAQTTDRLVLTVEDDGVGLPDELPTGGLGIHTMSFRARMIGATLSIERGTTGGTTVTCAALRTPPATDRSENLEYDHVKQR